MDYKFGMELQETFLVGGEVERVGGMNFVEVGEITLDQIRFLERHQAHTITLSVYGTEQQRHFSHNLEVHGFQTAHLMEYNYHYGRLYVKGVEKFGSKKVILIDKKNS